MFNGIFPCFKGFNHYALWPTTQRVSTNKKSSLYIKFIHFISIFELVRLPQYVFHCLLSYLINETCYRCQDQSYFTLLSNEEIYHPELQRSGVTLPFHEGYQYVAFPAIDGNQVIVRLIVHKIFSLLYFLGYKSYYSQRKT